MAERGKSVGVGFWFGVVGILFLVILASLYIYKLVNPDGFNTKIVDTFAGSSSENTGRVHPNSTNSDNNSTGAGSGDEPNTIVQDEGSGGVSVVLVIIGVLAAAGIVYFLIKTGGKSILLKKEITVKQAIDLCREWAWYEMQWRPYNHNNNFKEDKRGYNFKANAMELLRDSNGVPILVELSCAPRNSEGKVNSFETYTFSVRSDNPESRFMWIQGTLEEFYVWHHKRKKEGWSLQKSDVRDEQIEQLQFAKDKAFEKVVEDI